MDGVTTATALLGRHGITYRMLNHWVARGYIPGVEPTVGSGHKRRFTESQVDDILTLARLVEAGLRPEVAAAHLLAHPSPRALPLAVTLAPGIYLVLNPQERPS